TNTHTLTHTHTHTHTHSWFKTRGEEHNRENERRKTNTSLDVATSSVPHHRLCLMTHCPMASVKQEITHTYTDTHTQPHTRTLSSHTHTLSLFSAHSKPELVD